MVYYLKKKLKGETLLRKIINLAAGSLLPVGLGGCRLRTLSHESRCVLCVAGLEDSILQC